MAHTVIDALGIGHNHNTLHFFLCAYKLHRLNEEIVLADNVLNGKRTDKELSKVVLKRHAVKFMGIFRRLEIVKSVSVLAVYQNHLRLVFTLAQSSVKADAVNPARHVGLRDAPLYHPFKINDKVERHFIYIVGVYHHNILAPFCGACQIVIHVCKLTQK